MDRRARRIRELQTCAEQAIRQALADGAVPPAKEEWEVVVEKDHSGKPGEAIIRFVIPGKPTVNYRLDKAKERWVSFKAS